MEVTKCRLCRQQYPGNHYILLYVLIISPEIAHSVLSSKSERQKSGQWHEKWH